MEETKKVYENLIIKDRIAALRSQMAEYDIDAYIIPTDDFHGSEYVGSYFKAREFVSGFTGSAGTLVVLKNKAALWTDGRYFLQADEQLKGSGIELMRSGEPGVLKLDDYLAEEVESGGCIGFDGRCVSVNFVDELKKKTAGRSISFAWNKDLVDLIWAERPSISKEPVWELDIKYAGISREEKLAEVRKEMAEKNADVLITTALDEIAWLLNLRGNDVLYTPVFLAYMIISKNSAVLCIHDEVLSDDVRLGLSEAGIVTAGYDEVEAVIKNILGGFVWIDSSKMNYRLYQSLPENIKIINEPSPIALMKAVKNSTEMENVVKAHIKDGVAVTKFIYWLKKNVGKEKITEISAAEKLLEFRKKMEGFIDQSFEPIIAYGAHGAIVHYSATKESNARLLPKSFCLADTGAHFIEGSTDITRTIPLGELTQEEKKAYTLVLIGHLNLGAAKFMEGVRGANLDYAARAALWEYGMDFNHGTGHGVGNILSVHEGPQRIHWRLNDGTKTVFKEGMIISDEPGLYIAGKFGIRHENLVLCRKGERTEFGQFMYFDSLTMVPFDKSAINTSLMSDREIDRLNTYHKKVFDTISPYFEGEELEWLKEMTAAINK